MVQPSAPAGRDDHAELALKPTVPRVDGRFFRLNQGAHKTANIGLNPTGSLPKLYLRPPICGRRDTYGEHVMAMVGMSTLRTPRAHRGLSWGKLCAASGAGVLSALLVVGPATAQPMTSSAASTAAASSMAKVDPGISRRSGSTVSVIVQSLPGQTGLVQAVLHAQGATVGSSLPVVDGVEATMSAGAVAAVASSPAVKAITANRAGAFATYSSDASPATAAGVAAAAKSASEFVASTGASKVWASGDTGAGVGVAVIDTGIANMADVSGRVTYGPDLSGEGSTIDSYGHGTVMAGLIAGNGSASAANKGGYTGVAPGAHLIAVKTAGANGVADVSTILQAMNWVDAYHSQYNIRVLNLSWGTPSTQSPTIDPLDYAVERLWNDGIVVVTAAGNAGPGPATIVKPGDDPMVLTVGAYNDHNGATADSIPAWSSRGPTANGTAKPDLVAPGRTLVALRAYGSTVETQNPSALVAPSYITGSGTSEATAVTSGLAALVIAAHPGYTPDQVKAVLVAGADPIRGLSRSAEGAGRVRVDQAIKASPGPARQQASPATGLGSLEASRGGRDVTASCNGTPTLIQGEIDVRCNVWNPAAWTGSSWTGSSWTGSSWTGSSWTGSSWTGSSWTGGSWTGSSWTGSSWTGSSWTGSSWTGSSWTGSSWTGSSWTGSSWTGSSWTGSSWTGSSWTGDSWGGSQTAFWGGQPKAGDHVAGEVAAAA